MGFLRKFYPLITVTLLMSPGAVRSEASDAGVPDPNPVTTVGSVDLDRYIGIWYEAAKIPNRFQNKCTGGTVAEYKLRRDGRLDVLNRCRTGDGKTDQAEGVARIVDGTGNAQLKVSFVSFMGKRLFWGDYWVIGLDEDYQWAIVGTPDRKYGWVLSRSPQLDEPTRAEIFGIIERNGYSREAFETSTP